MLDGFRVREDFYRRATCDLLPSYKLERPAFGGRKRTPLRIAYRVAAPARTQVTVLRGWNSIDVRKVGHDKSRFRFVNTHLESFFAGTRTAQATELMDASCAVDTSLPVILLGDLNSDPAAPAADAAAYNVITDAGFADRGVELNTCCFGESITEPPPADFGSRI